MNVRWLGLFLGLLISALVLTASATPAFAQDPAQQSAQQSAKRPAQQSAPESIKPPPADAELQWDESWERFRWWEYPTSSALMVFGFSARFLIEDPEPNWTSVWSVDQEILDAIAVRENPAYENIRLFSDLGFYGSMVYRFVDSALLTGLLHENSWDVAWQMSWIDFESFAVVASVLWGAQIFVGRVRPTAANCEDPTRLGHLCDKNNADYARSFIAGHTATATAAAGLTCLHHSRLPLYGGGLADDLACGVMITNAVLNGVARVVSEQHYPSDLLMGWALGFGAGWVLPQVLHYGWGDDEDEDAAETVGLPAPEPKPGAPIFTVSPTVIDQRPGLFLLGRF
jgi:membrane-associated phospholipid phosphatase